MQLSKFVQVLYALGYTLTGTLLSMTTSRSPEPQDVATLVFAFPAFLITLLFIFAAFTTGLWVTDQLRIQSLVDCRISTLFVALGVGSVALYLFGYLLLSMGLFSAAYAPLLWFTLSLPFSAKQKQLRMLIRPGRKLQKTDWIHLIPITLILLRGLESLQLHRHGDAYIAYLNASRAIGSDGSFSLMLELPQLFVVTSWETLYSWGTALMGLHGGAGLDLSQYFAQWCSSLIASTGIALGVYSFGNAFFKNTSPHLSRAWSFMIPLAATLALQAAPIRWTANLAKHDLGVAFWAMVALFLSLYSKPTTGSGLITGLMIGAAVIGKLPLVVFGLILFAVIAIRTPRALLPAILGGSLGVAPILLRNFLLTRNPMFPWLSNWFPESASLLSPTLREGMLRPTQSAFTWGQQGQYSLEFLTQVPWSIGMLFLGIFLLIKKPNSTELQRSVWTPPILITLVSILSFNLVFRSGTEIRYQNVALVLACAFGVLTTGQLLIIFTQRFSSKLQQTAQIIFALLLLSLTNLPFFSLFQIGTSKYAPISSRLVELNGGPGKLWLRQNLQRDEQALSVGDPLLYYVQDKHVIELVQNPEWNQKFLVLGFSDFVQAVCQIPIQYIYVATDLDIWQLHSKGKEFFEYMNSLKRPACARLNLKQHQIWDTRCICNP